MAAHEIYDSRLPFVNVTPDNPNWSVSEQEKINLHYRNAMEIENKVCRYVKMIVMSDSFKTHFSNLAEPFSRFFGIDQSQLKPHKDPTGDFLEMAKFSERLSEGIEITFEVVKEVAQHLMKIKNQISIPQVLKLRDSITLIKFIETLTELFENNQNVFSTPEAINELNSINLFNPQDISQYNLDSNKILCYTLYLKFISKQMDRIVVTYALRKTMKCAMDNFIGRKFQCRILDIVIPERNRTLAKHGSETQKSLLLEKINQAYDLKMRFEGTENPDERLAAAYEIYNLTVGKKSKGKRPNKSIGLPPVCTTLFLKAYVLISSDGIIKDKIKKHLCAHFKIIENLEKSYKGIGVER